MPIPSRITVAGSGTVAPTALLTVDVVIAGPPLGSSSTPTGVPSVEPTLPSVSAVHGAECGDPSLPSGAPAHGVGEVPKVPTDPSLPVDSGVHGAERVIPSLPSEPDRAVHGATW